MKLPESERGMLSGDANCGSLGGDCPIEDLIDKKLAIKKQHVHFKTVDPIFDAAIGARQEGMLQTKGRW